MGSLILYLLKNLKKVLRMCVDYIDINKVCLKDSYSLSRIEQLVDTISGYELLTFMDALLGYNQIKMIP